MLLLHLRLANPSSAKKLANPPKHFTKAFNLLIMIWRTFLSNCRQTLFGR